MMTRLIDWIHHVGVSFHVDKSRHLSEWNSSFFINLNVRVFLNNFFPAVCVVELACSQGTLVHCTGSFEWLVACATASLLCVFLLGCLVLA